MDALMSPTAQRVREYIVTNFMYAYPDATLGDNDALLGRGILDSLGVVELVAFVEESFGIRVADEDITEANLGSVAAIAQYVERAQSA